MVAIVVEIQTRLDQLLFCSCSKNPYNPWGNPYLILWKKRGNFQLPIVPIVALFSKCQLYCLAVKNKNSI